MGFMDKLPFGKKKDDDLGGLDDFSDLGDFGLDDSGPSPSDQTAGLSGTGEIGSMPSPAAPPGGESLHKEEVMPSSASQQMGGDLRMSPVQAAQHPASMEAPSHDQAAYGMQPAPQHQAAQAPPPPQTQAPAQQPSFQYQQQYQQQPQQQFQSHLFTDSSTGDISKDLQIIQAKLDTIRASVDSINRRLENLERIAEGGKQRYSW